MFKRGVIYKIKSGGGLYFSIDGNVMFRANGGTWIKSASSERDLIRMLEGGTIIPLVDDEAISPTSISDAKISGEINHANAESWKDSELKRLLGDVIHQSVEDALSKKIADIVDKFSRQSPIETKVEGSERADNPVTKEYFYSGKEYRPDGSIAGTFGGIFLSEKKYHGRAFDDLFKLVNSEITAGNYADFEKFDLIK